MDVQKPLTCLLTLIPIKTWIFLMLQENLFGICFNTMLNKAKKKIKKTILSERGKPNSYIVESIIIQVQGS
jgi:hypothetical protein